MRETFIKGLNDNFDLSLGSNTDLVFEVMVKNYTQQKLHL